jgi:hypothetical protein
MLLFDCLRKQMSNDATADERAVLVLFEAAQAARDHVGPVESDYEPLEILLGAEEHKLVEQYSKIEERFDRFFRLDVASITKVEEQEPPEIEYESSSVASVPEDNARLYGTDRLHGTLIDENVGIGELPRHTEESKGMLSPHNSQKSPASHNRTASLESVDRAKSRSASFPDKGVKPSDWTGALSLIGIWAIGATDAVGMKTIFEDWSADTVPFAQSIQLETSDTISDLVDDLPVNPGLEEGNPLLLLDEGEETRAILGDYLMNFESTPDRVNRWMLHQLRVSPHEIYTLRRYVTKVEELSVTRHWATSVLEEWPHDSLGHNHSYYQGSIEFEENKDNPQRVRYHGACPPGCAYDHSWWAPQSSTFSTPDILPKPSSQLRETFYKPKPHELLTALYDDHD